MREFDRFTWIKTRDGSPTLFHNEEGAAFRSQKGAFTESYNVFVKPALEFATTRIDKNTQLRVLEFGLGPGTNWLLWHIFQNLSPELRDLKIDYVAIEKDKSSFDMGFDFWMESCEQLSPMISASCEVTLEFPPEQLRKIITTARKNLTIVPSLELLSESLTGQPSANSEATSQKNTFDICLFDPFGYDVNPQAYQPEALLLLKSHLALPSKALSYACNSKFQRSLKEAGFDLATPFSGAAQLKRERIEFWPKQQ